MALSADIGDPTFPLKLLFDIYLAPILHLCLSSAKLQDYQKEEDCWEIITTF